MKWLLNHKIFGSSGLLCSSNDATPPKCAACLVGAQQRRSIENNKRTQTKRGALVREQLNPGQKIFSDQYVSSVHGRNYNGRGQEQTSNFFIEGTVFCDAATSFLSIHHQVSFTTTETIKSKIQFEREAMSVGNNIDSYTTDNGFYTAKDFTDHLAEAGQQKNLVE